MSDLVVPIETPVDNKWKKISIGLGVALTLVLIFVIYHMVVQMPAMEPKLGTSHDISRDGDYLIVVPADCEIEIGDGSVVEKKTMKTGANKLSLASGSKVRCEKEFWLISL